LLVFEIFLKPGWCLVVGAPGIRDAKSEFKAERAFQGSPLLGDVSCNRV